ASLGRLLLLRCRAVLWPHIAAVVWGVLVQCANWTWPLTPLENRLRSLGGGAGYEGGFVEHYVRAVLYPERLTYSFRFTLGVLLIVINLFVYAYLVFRMRRAVRARLA